jgi:hypothetical protein
VAAAGTAGVRPGRLRPGVDVAAGAGVVSPGMPRPDVDVAAGAGDVRPGIPSPGVALVAGVVGDTNPGSSDEPVVGAAACCGILIDALASGGGVAG